jgi:NAD(P)-dependent dehydrogenase (short-subunit alcohol dehydrogenase family)
MDTILMRNREKLLLGALGGAGILWGTRAWLRSRRRIDLADRVVIITGASSGHGYIVARQAAEHGAHLVLAARDLEALKAAEAELPRHGAPSVMAVATDVREPAQVEALVAQAVARHGRIDVLVNNAGIISVGPVEAMTPEDFRAAMETNFWGAFHATRSVLPQMRAQRFGRIANVVSLGGKRAVPHMLPYTASKFALAGFTQGLRTELARENILVTGIYPSTMRTGGHTHAWLKGNAEAEYIWFALSDTIPGLSVSAERVARRLWRAVCDGEAEVVVGWPARLIVVLEALFPNEIAELLGLADLLLPGPVADDAPAVQGQDLSGTPADLLNRAIPAGTRPGGAG